MRHGVVILTKDEACAARTQRSPKGPPVVWLRVGNTTNPVKRGWIEPRIPGIVQLVGEGYRLVEVV